MRKPDAILTDTSHHWMTVTEAARYFGKADMTIRYWCANGFFVSDVKCKLFRDVSHHWWIGVPLREVSCQTSTHQAVPPTL